MKRLVALLLLVAAFALQLHGLPAAAQAQGQPGGLTFYGALAKLFGCEPSGPCIRLSTFDVSMRVEPAEGFIYTDHTMDAEVVGERLEDIKNWVFWAANEVTGASIDGVQVPVVVGAPVQGSTASYTTSFLFSAAAARATKGSRVRLVISTRSVVPAEEEMERYGTVVDLQVPASELSALCPWGSEWTLHVIVPAGWAAIAGGEPEQQGVPFDEDSVVYSRRIPANMMGANTMVAVGPYSRVKLDVPGDCGLWLTPEETTRTADLVAAVTEVLTRADDVIVRRFGLPGLDRLEVVNASRPGRSASGKGPVGLVLVEYGRGIDFAPETFARVFSHELCHQWFPGRAQIDFTTALWLSEGMATYFDSCYLREEWPPDGYFMGQMGQGWPAYSISDASSKLASLPNNVKQKILYLKSAWVAHMLRLKIGNEAFLRTLRRFYSTEAGRLLGTADFQLLAEGESGLELDVFFKQWLDTAMLPEVTFQDLKVSRAAGGWLVTGTLSNSQPMELSPVGIVVIDGTGRAGTVEVELAAGGGDPSRQATEFQIVAPSLASRLVLDPDGNVLNAAETGREAVLWRIWLRQPGTLAAIAVLAAGIGCSALVVSRRRRLRTGNWMGNEDVFR